MAVADRCKTGTGPNETSQAHGDQCHISPLRTVSELAHLQAKSATLAQNSEA